jgi:hypothetical protein
VNATISQWREIEGNEALPGDLRREVRCPEVALEACTGCSWKIWGGCETTLDLHALAGAA